jgi:putative hydrolase of the HAD superfamily
MPLKVKWILFDFGGCLDSDGIHSRTLFLNQFVKNHLIPDTVNHPDFENAYTHADNKIIKESLVINSTLGKMNECMCEIIAKKLSIKNPAAVSKAANDITTIQSSYLTRNKKILEKLAQHYKLGIISNFSGNLAVILEEFSLRQYFDFILDSFHVGLSKPNSEIFKLAIQKCDVASSLICFVGDNIDRDIIPAKALEMKTVLISPTTDANQADFTMTSILDL